jgi:DNA (cytosine-5)-methyltransferase 1
LFFEALRIIDEYRPKFAIAENVKALTSKKFAEEFKIVLESLEEIGYRNYWQVLNAKDYGIPQNRERVFIVSIREDIDKGFTFPEAVPLELRLKDMLEENVNEGYYLSETMLKFFIENDAKQHERGNGFRFSPTDGEGTAKTITTRAGSRMDDNFIETNEIAMRKVGNVYPSGGQNGNVYDEGGVSPTISSGVTNTKKNGGIGSSNAPKILTRGVSVRKLTPTECYKLMGFDAKDCHKCSEGGISNSQLYKQAGNSIVVNVLEAIFSKLGETYEEFASR